MRKPALCQMRSLISAFVIGCLGSIISQVSIFAISLLLLASVAEQAGLSLTWSETPEDRFSHDVAQFMLFYGLLTITIMILSFVTKRSVQCRPRSDCSLLPFCIFLHITLW